MRLTINNLIYQYSNQTDFSVKIDTATHDFQQNLGIYGLSGSGKTTVGKLLAKILTPQTGNIRWIPESPYVLYSAQQSENIFLGNTIDKTLAMVAKNNQHVRAPETQISQYLEYFQVDYTRIKRKEGYELSAGELRKFALSLAFVCKPDILVLDEPTIGLDIKSRNALSHLLIETKRPLVLITHDYEFLKRICHQLWVLDKGNLVYQGNFFDLEKNRKLCTEIGVDIFFQLLQRRKKYFTRLEIQKK
ncbi:MAG: ATP-binding cassette domain-containing protein [Fidelibacterota bacterium]